MTSNFSGELHSCGMTVCLPVQGLDRDEAGCERAREATAEVADNNAILAANNAMQLNHDQRLLLRGVYSCGMTVWLPDAGP